MEKIHFESFRCFREQQNVKLAPLTLLIGENSTGKTSFLALVRILTHLARGDTEFDFKEPPYDLGSFNEVAHTRAGPAGRANEFTIGFETRQKGRASRSGPTNTIFVDATFGKQGSAPSLTRRRIEAADLLIDESIDNGGAILRNSRNTSRNVAL